MASAARWFSGRFGRLPFVTMAFIQILFAVLLFAVLLSSTLLLVPGIAVAGSPQWFANSPEQQLEWLLAEARRSPSVEEKIQALSLASALLEQRTSLQPEQCIDADLAATRQAISNELLALLLSADASPADQRQALTVWQQRREQQLAEALGDRCLPATPPLASLLAEQPLDTVVLHVILLPQRVELLLTHNGTTTRYSTAVPKARVVAVAARFQRAVQQNQPRAERYGSRLSSWLLQPFWSQLQGILSEVSISRLQLHVDQQLLSLPWAALPEPVNGPIVNGPGGDEDASGLATSSPMGFALPIAVAAGRASLVDNEAESAPRVLAAMLDNPELLADAGFSPLPAVEAELAQIQSLLPTRRLENQRLTRAGISRVLGGRDYSILHLATHGELGSADNSFVLLADGPLPLSSLGDLVNERRYSEQPLRLVTLSACETALASGRGKNGNDAGESNESTPDDGRLGLAGVALQAGARSALASLWAVDDSATAALMGLFYGELKQARSVAEALQRARRKMPELGYKNARDWAGFQVFGSGR